jgi:hypothetical protein
MERRNWTPEEQRTAVIAYFFMLEAQQKGHSFNKAAIARQVLPRLNNRTKGSYEAKLMNISAIMTAHGLPTVKGYKSLGHIQKSLADAVLAALPQQYRSQAA